jgi:hypothetical protein
MRKRGYNVGILKQIWGASREDVISVVSADARARRPDESKRVHPEKIRADKIRRLDERGPAYMSAAGWRRAQELLHAAQERPARKKNLKKS